MAKTTKISNVNNTTMSKDTKKNNNKAAAAAPMVASPGNSKPIQFSDSDLGYQYAELPENTTFLESLAHNKNYKPGVMYTAAQQTESDGTRKTFLYRLDPTDRDQPLQLVGGPLQARDGSEDITIFGSSLSNAGMLYLCAFNRNSILQFNLPDMEQGTAGPTKCQREITVPCPNDVAVDPNDDAIVYVAGGNFERYCSFKVSSAPHGCLWRITLPSSAQKAKVDPLVDGLDTLAGIEVKDSQVWLTQLVNMITVQAGQKPTQVWNGQTGGTSNKEGYVWLADNVDQFQVNDNESYMLSVAYSTTAKRAAKLLTKTKLSTLGMIGAQVLTAYWDKESVRKALKDPEVNGKLDYTYDVEGQSLQPVRLFLVNPDNTQQAYHFEVYLTETSRHHGLETVSYPEAGTRRYFNEQCTAAAQLQANDGSDYIVCVNFECPRLLLLKADKIKQVIASGGAATSD